MGGHCRPRLAPPGQDQPASSCQPRQPAARTAHSTPSSSAVHRCCTSASSRRRGASWRSSSGRAYTPYAVSGALCGIGARPRPTSLRCRLVRAGRPHSAGGTRCRQQSGGSSSGPHAQTRLLHLHQRCLLHTPHNRPHQVGRRPRRLKQHAVADRQALQRRQPCAQAARGSARLPGRGLQGAQARWHPPASAAAHPSGRRPRSDRRASRSHLGRCRATPPAAPAAATAALAAPPGWLAGSGHRGRASLRRRRGGTLAPPTEEAVGRPAGGRGSGALRSHPPIFRWQAKPPVRWWHAPEASARSCRQVRCVMNWASGNCRLRAGSAGSSCMCRLVRRSRQRSVAACSDSRSCAHGGGHEHRRRAGHRHVPTMHAHTPPARGLGRGRGRLPCPPAHCTAQWSAAAGWAPRAAAGTPGRPARRSPRAPRRRPGGAGAGAPHVGRRRQTRRPARPPWAGACSGARACRGWGRQGARGGWRAQPNARPRACVWGL